VLEKKAIAYQPAIAKDMLFYTSGYTWCKSKMAVIKMKPLVKQAEPATHPFSGFRNFMVAILRNRVFLICLLLALLVFTIQGFTALFALPSVFYLGFAFAGFVWAAFRAYKDLSVAYRNVITPKPVEKIARSELSISFLSGNAYAYAIGDPYAGQNHYITKMQKTRGVKSRFDERGVFYINDQVYYRMSKASLTINIRIENSGDLPLDVLVIRLENNLDLNYLKLAKDEICLHGKKLSLPFPLQSGEFALLQAKYEIIASKDSTNDLFAADFRALPRSILHELAFDTNDAHGKRQTYSSKIETSSKPLIDLYVKQWREFDQQEYLFFAGHSTP
jgi:hypothetical protein